MSFVKLGYQDGGMLMYLFQGHSDVLLHRKTNQGFATFRFYQPGALPYELCCQYKKCKEYRGRVYMKQVTRKRFFYQTLEAFIYQNM